MLNNTQPSSRLLSTPRPFLHYTLLALLAVATVAGAWAARVLSRDADQLRERLSLESDNARRGFISITNMVEAIASKHRNGDRLKPTEIETLRIAQRYLREVLQNVGEDTELNAMSKAVRARVHQSLGSIGRCLAELDESAQAFQQSIADLDDLLDCFPRDHEIWLSRSRVTREYSLVQIARGQTDAAREATRDLLTLIKARAQACPEAAIYPSEQAYLYGQLAVISASCRRWNEAAQSAAECRYVLTQLTESWPDSFEYSRRSIEADLILARLRLHAGQPADAVRACRRCMGMIELAAARFPELRPVEQFLREEVACVRDLARRASAGEPPESLPLGSDWL